MPRHKPVFFSDPACLSVRACALGSPHCSVQKLASSLLLHPAAARWSRLRLRLPAFSPRCRTSGEGGGAAGLRSEAGQKDIRRRGPAALQLSREGIGEGGGGGGSSLTSKREQGKHKLKAGGEERGKAQGFPAAQRKRLQKEESFGLLTERESKASSERACGFAINSGGLKPRESIRCSCHHSPPL